MSIGTASQDSHTVSHNREPVALPRSAFVPNITAKSTKPPPRHSHGHPKSALLQTIPPPFSAESETSYSPPVQCSYGTKTMSAQGRLQTDSSPRRIGRRFLL